MAHPQIRVCVSVSGLHGVTRPGDEGRRGAEGGENTCLTPSVQQRGYVPVRSHHKPGHRHASPNRPDPEVSRPL